MSRIKLFDLEFESDHYYIKRPRVVEQIQFDNRTFYAKFERIDESLTPLLVKQHLNRDYTIAVPLLKDNRTNYLVIEYKGEEYQRFIALIQHLFHTMHIMKYYIYHGREKEKIQVFVPVAHITLQEAEEKLSMITERLKSRLSKRWKTLPTTLLPEAYNIVTLPYEKL